MLHRKRLARAALVLALPLTLAMTSSALASPVEGPSGEAFYTPPATLPEGGPGTLIWYRPTSVNLNVTLPGVTAYDVMYKSTNETGNPNVVTGTVLVPTAAWSGSGPRPLVDYAVGTQGLAHSCAPSLQMVAGTEYDGGAIIAALKKGYAVTVSDYAGFTNGATPEYIAGKSEGQAVLDIAKAAPQIPSGGVSSSAPVSIWGYSQGGQAAGWAGELLPSYASGLHTVGVAAGGVPANLQALAEYAEGTPGAAFGLDSVVGLSFAYASIMEPELQLHEVLSEEGFEAFTKLRGECALQSLAEFHDIPFSRYSKHHETFPELQKNDVLIESVVKDQKVGTMAVPVPVYHYHGLQDEFVPVTQDAELHEAWCSRGVKDDFQLYPGDHLLTDPTAIPYVMKWIEERFEGKAAPSTCGQHSSVSELPASARVTPPTGDLVVPVPAWQVSGSITAKKLGISLKVPPGATLSAEADITTGKLSASLFVPPIEETVKLFGLIPVTIAGSLTQAGPINGTTRLSNSGVLSLSATGGATLTTKSLTVLGLRIPLECHTEKPIELPLSVEEPVNALSTGSISLSDNVTIPPFTGCGIFGPLTSLILSGSGNPLNLSAAPPPPISW
ncbi:MAG: lipase family protein [Solirubrobacteraceae bacterium]